MANCEENEPVPADWELSPEDWEPSKSTQPRQVGNGLSVAALVLPVLSGGLLLLVAYDAAAWVISVGTVFITALLLSIDAGRLERLDAEGLGKGFSGWLFLKTLGLMFLIWIVAYPIAYFRRRRFGGPDLGNLAIVVALFFVGAPMLRAVLVSTAAPMHQASRGQGLVPACDSREVVQLLDKLFRQTSVGSTIRAIDGHRQVRYDRAADSRHGQCVLHADDGYAVVQYVVQWRDRDKGQFEVRITR